jgi:hypothetical protein
VELDEDELDMIADALAELALDEPAEIELRDTLLAKIEEALEDAG